MANPARGYNAHLDRRMRALLPACREASTVIITNMGAANPRAAAERTRDIARELGLAGLKIACIEGDDVTASVPMTQEFMDEPGILGDVKRPIVGMNAYLGDDAIRPALQVGADVIIGGRLADPSMYLAPLMHRFGWGADDLPRLGAGTLVGHLMECGMQITGGYFADPGVKDVPNLARCGYPIAEVAADGSAVISKITRHRRLRHASDGEGATALRGARPGGLPDARRHRRFQPCDDRRSRQGSRARFRRNGPCAAGAAESHRRLRCRLSRARPASAMPVRQPPRGRLAAEIVAERLKTTHKIAADTRIDLIGASSLFATAGDRRPKAKTCACTLPCARRSAKRPN